MDDAIESLAPVQRISLVQRGRMRRAALKAMLARKETRKDWMNTDNIADVFGCSRHNAETILRDVMEKENAN